MSEYFEDPRYRRAMRTMDPIERHSLLQQLRADPRMNPNGAWTDTSLAELEHAAAMRRWINERPVSGVTAGLLAPYGYWMSKLIMPTATPPSMGQVGAGYAGYIQGLRDLWNER